MSEEELDELYPDENIESKVLTTTMFDEPKEEIKPKKPRAKPKRAKKEHYVDEAEAFYKELEGVMSAITGSIRTGNATGAYNKLEFVKREYKRIFL